MQPYIFNSTKVLKSFYLIHFRLRKFKYNYKYNINMYRTRVFMNRATNIRSEKTLIKLLFMYS